MQLDSVDRRLLRALQQNCQESIAELGRTVGLSTSACHRRIKLLEEAGVISGYGARLDRGKLGLTLEFFVEVSLGAQSDKVLAAFERAVGQEPEILECHLMAGRTDYLLRVVAADAVDFERIHRERLTKLPGITSLQCHMAIRTVRSWSGYPVRSA